MQQYKITNRTSRKEQILNYDQFIRFMDKNSMREYTYTPIISDHKKQQKTINQITIGITCFLIIILTTKILLQWI